MKAVFRKGVIAAFLFLSLQSGAAGFTMEAAETGENTGVLWIREEEAFLEESGAENDAGERAEELQMPADEAAQEELLDCPAEVSEDSGIFPWDLFIDTEGTTAPVEDLVCEDRSVLQMENAFERTDLRLRIQAPEGVWFESGTKEIVRSWERDRKEMQIPFFYEGRFPLAEDFGLKAEPEIPEEELFTAQAEEAVGMETAEAEPPADFSAPEVVTGADLAVEVTADRTLAGPGDRICWHICIQNTGEIPLYEVETELTASEGIEALCVQCPESVRVIEAGRLYEIGKIEPGETLNLEAEGMVSPNGIYGSFWMTTRLSAKESGVEKVSRKAQVEGILPTPTPTPAETAQAAVRPVETQKADAEPLQKAGLVSASSGSGPYEKKAETKTEMVSRRSAENPKTGDNSPLGLLIVLLLLSAGLVILIGTFRSH